MSNAPSLFVVMFFVLVVFAIVGGTVIGSFESSPYYDVMIVVFSVLLLFVFGVLFFFIIRHFRTNKITII